MGARDPMLRPIHVARRVVIDDKDRVWVGHKHSFELAVDGALLTTLYDDRVPLRVWDTKDRVSSRARFDRIFVLGLISTRTLTTIFSRALLCRDAPHTGMCHGLPGVHVDPIPIDGWDRRQLLCPVDAKHPNRSTHLPPCSPFAASHLSHI